MTKARQKGALLGREEVVEGVLQSLLTAEGHGSLIIGDEGMGKTSVAAAVLALAGNQMRPFHAFASPVLAGEPYGALAPFLTGLPDGTPSSPSLVMRALVRELRTDAAETAVLVIDDAQFLDGSSVAMLAQLAAANQAKFIFLCAPFPAAPAELWSMCSDGLLNSFELPGLDTATMQELCLEALGPQVFPSASAVLCRQAAGNPMFLLELIKQAQATGVLFERNGTWLLVEQPHGATARARNAVRNQLRQFTQNQRHALEYVAVAGSLGLETLHEVCDSGTVDELEEIGLIQISAVPLQVVTLAVPPTGEAIAELLPLARTRAIRRRLLTLADLPRMGGARLVHYIDWALESGFKVADGDVLRAAQLANRLCLPDFAERAVAMVAAPELIESARLEQLRVFIWRGERESLQATVLDILKRSLNPETVRHAAALAGHVGLRPGLDGTALAGLATAWRAAVQRLEGRGLLADEAVMEDHCTSVRLLEIQAMHVAGDYQGTESELARIHGAPGASADNLLDSSTLLSEVMAATGRAAQALELADHAGGLLSLDNGRLAHFHEFVLRRRLWALCHAGEFGQLRNAVEQSIEQHASSLLYFGGTYQVALGLCDVAQGAMNDGLQRLAQAVEALQESDPGNDLPLGLAAAAYAAGVLGRESVSEEYAKRFEAAGPGQGAASALRSQAYVLAARGMFEGNPRPSLRRVADEAASIGMFHVEMDVLTLGIHAGDLGLALRLKAVALRCEGRDAEHSAAYARAVAEKDPVALLAFSDEAEHDLRELAAARSAANAVAILNRRGDRNRLHGAQRVAKHRLARLIYGHSSLSDRLSTVPQLTRREQKVAALVHAGASNRDIATAFGLSLRTVEGHLYRIFAKLGISDRSEIANAALESWHA